MLPLVSKTKPIEIGASSLEKLRDLLLDFVFEQPEVLLFETRDEPVQRIGHRNVNQHQRFVTRISTDRASGAAASRGRTRSLGRCSPPVSGDFCSVDFCSVCPAERDS